jgi:hypothetical protein
LEAQDMLPEDIAYLRHAHTRAVRIDDATGARMREEFRVKASQAVERIRQLRDRFNDFKEG